MDELVHAIGMDPVELRLRNYAEDNPQLGLPWSSKALRACFEKRAERFGWWDRGPRPGSMRDGNWLVGYGIAGVSFFWFGGTIGGTGMALLEETVTDPATGRIASANLGDCGFMELSGAPMLGITCDDVSWPISGALLNRRCSGPW